ncbi:MAG TPA: PAS domain-containing sensor histidine kinase [Polyangiaceae bacterium]|nr:PAS domain-containing sensor histidine kinase [Polyangiaceae bacterium]
MTRPLNSTEYRLLVEHSPVMIWRADTSSSCDYFNPTWLAFTGRTLEQELGDGWAAAVHPEDLDRCVAYYLEHFHRRQAFEMEYRLRRHDGVFRWIFDRGVPFTDDSGKFAGFIGSCVDIDDRRKAQAAQEQQSQEQLAIAREFEKSILAIVSHDIRNPLGTIQLAAQVLQGVPDPAGTVRRAADAVARGVRRIQHIIGDLLDLSRERDGAGISVEPKATELRALCRQIIDELEATARGRSILFECDHEVPGSWDEQRLLQAISNLASNAVQHGAPGSPIRLRVRGDEQRVSVEVHNQGSIPPELLPHIFQPFHSGRPRSRRGDGLGLGLFIARAIARAHGGTLEVESAAGATLFRLALPRHAPAVSP